MAVLSRKQRVAVPNGQQRLVLIAFAETVEPNRCETATVRACDITWSIEDLLSSQLKTIQPKISLKGP